MGRKKSEYAVYKGDKLLGIGTLDELAKELKVKKRTILFYARPIYQKRGLGSKSNNRRITIKLDD